MVLARQSAVPLVGLTIAVLVAAAAGVILAISPPWAVLFVALVLVITLGVVLRAVPAAVVLTGLAVVLGGFIDFPGRYSFGSATGQALLTAAVLLCGSIVVIVEFPALPAPARRPAILFSLFVCYGILSTFWGGSADITTIQNLFVFALLPVMVACGALASCRVANPNALVAGLVAVALVPALAFGVNFILTGTLVGPRSVALFALIPLAWALAQVRAGKRAYLILSVCLLVLILVTLSRAAFITALVLTVVAYLDLNSISRLVRSVLIIGSICFIGLWAITSFDPLASRFQHGDVVSVRGLDVNVSGRGELWSYAWEGIKDRPIVGHGSGSVERGIMNQFPGQGHPHNDYLRLLFDYGVVGTFLWCLAYFELARAVIRRESHFVSSPIHTGALLMLLIVGLSMITDNVLVYSFVIGPAAAIIGMSLGERSRTDRPTTELSVPHFGPTDVLDD